MNAPLVNCPDCGKLVAAYDKGQFTHPKTEKPELILRLDVTPIDPDWILI